MARFLTDPTIAAILLAVGVLGLVLEFFTPGTFIPAIVGLTALGLFFLGAIWPAFPAHSPSSCCLAGCCWWYLSFL